MGHTVLSNICRCTFTVLMVDVHRESCLCLLYRLYLDLTKNALDTHMYDHHQSINRPLFPHSCAQKLSWSFSTALLRATILFVFREQLLCHSESIFSFVKGNLTLFSFPKEQDIKQQQIQFVFGDRLTPTLPSVYGISQMSVFTNCSSIAAFYLKNVTLSISALWMYRKSSNSSHAILLNRIRLNFKNWRFE